MKSIEVLLKAHCSAFEYIEFTRKYPKKFIIVLARGEPGSEPFDQLYRKHMENCISKKELFLNLRDRYLSDADVVQLVNNELATVRRQMKWTGFRTQQTSNKLKENNHAWINLLPWLERELGDLDALKVDYKPKRTKERKIALKTSIAAIKYDYASQYDVQRLLKITGPRPQLGQDGLQKRQEFQYITEKLRTILHSKGKKGSPENIIHCIKRLQRGRESGVPDKAFAVLDCYELAYSEVEKTIFFTDMFGCRVSRSKSSISNIYRKRLPDEGDSDQ